MQSLEPDSPTAPSACTRTSFHWQILIDIETSPVVSGCSSRRTTSLDVLRAEAGHASIARHCCFNRSVRGDAGLDDLLPPSGRYAGPRVSSRSPGRESKAQFGSREILSETGYVLGTLRDDISSGGSQSGTSEFARDCGAPSRKPSQAKGPACQGNTAAARCPGHEPTASSNSQTSPCPAPVGDQLNAAANDCAYGSRDAPWTVPAWVRQVEGIIISV